MSAEIASLENVRAAVAKIRASGGVATADRVIANMGGGSKSTVLRHLKLLRDGLPVNDVVPQSVLDLAKPAIVDIFSAGEKAGSDRSAAGLIRLTTDIAELEAQADELAAENATLSHRLELAEVDRDQLAERLRALETALSVAEGELQAARDDLARERGTSAEKLADFMKRVEEGVAVIARNRSTLRLPKDRQHSS